MHRQINDLELNTLQKFRLNRYDWFNQVFCKCILVWITIPSVVYGGASTIASRTIILGSPGCSPFTYGSLEINSNNVDKANMYLRFECSRSNCYSCISE